MLTVTKTELKESKKMKKKNEKKTILLLDVSNLFFLEPLELSADK